MAQGQPIGKRPEVPGIPRPTGPAGAFLDQLETGQTSRPFGWLLDMIGHITGTMQQGQAQPATPGQPGQAAQPGQQQPATQQTTPGKQSDAGQAQPQQPVPGGMIDPNTAQQLVSVFQPNALSNLGLLPQQQGSWNWVLSMMQQNQAANAQQQGKMPGNDLLSVVRQFTGKAGGAPTPNAGGSNGA